MNQKTFEITEDDLITLCKMVIRKLEDFTKDLGGIDKVINYPYLDSMWTNYMLGKSKKQYKEWNGVIPDWLKDKDVDNESIYCEPESWYRTDIAVVDYSNDGSWIKGKYEILAIIEHENNPAETKGHTRQLYDFNVPEKILFTWTNDKHNTNEPEKIIEMFREVEKLCSDMKIDNMGQIYLIVGNWDMFVKYFKEKNSNIKVDDIFRIESIKSGICRCVEEK